MTKTEYRYIVQENERDEHKEGDMNWTERKQYPQTIGWTEAQELNARGWEIILSGRVRRNLREVIRIRPHTEELAFNETVREFVRSHYDNEFKAYK